MAREALNARQLEVLRWIADGCPDGVMKDITYKLSAIALKSRHLVTLSKRGGWHADMTDDGTYYLAHGGYPIAESTRSTPEKRVTVQQSSRTAKPHTPHRIGTSNESRPKGAVNADIGSEGVRVAPAPVVKPKLPEVPVPDRLSNPHPVVAFLRDDKHRLDVSGPARPRALRIAQGLITALEQRGWTVQVPTRSRTGWGGAEDARVAFVINTGENEIPVQFEQERDRTPHVPTATELHDKAGSSWLRIPEYDYAPSERIRIELGSLWWGYGRRQHSWGDGKKGVLPQKLPAIVEEIARRHDEVRLRRIDDERQEAEKQRLWQIAVEEAKVLLRESHRAGVLTQEAANWRKANGLREYVTAMQSATEHLEDAEREADARAWIEWTGKFADRLDPLTNPIGMPDDLEPTREALAPFLPKRDRRDY